MTITLAYNVELSEHRCWECGRWWAAEATGPGDTGCPRCTSRRLRNAQDGNAKRDRTIAALKGAITKLRNQRQLVKGGA